ncbi:unnamed protein product [Spodoptera exigua]|nr:unnamed protein product [Spodoptera exigua]
MRDIKKYRYSVIKLKKTGDCSLDPYVCVPYSWLKSTKKPVVVKYPNEVKSLTAYRVKHCEESQPDWLEFGADIKYSTNSYVDAQKCLSKLLHGYREHNSPKDNTPATDTETSQDLEPPNETENIDVKTYGTRNKTNEIQTTNKTGDDDDDNMQIEEIVSKSPAMGELPPKTTGYKQKNVSRQKVKGKKVVPNLIIKKVKPTKNKFKSKLIVKTKPKPKEIVENKSCTEQDSSELDTTSNTIDTDNETEGVKLDPKNMSLDVLWKTIQDQISVIEQLQQSDNEINAIVDRMSTSIKDVGTLESLIDQLETLVEHNEEQEATEAETVENETEELEREMVQEEGEKDDGKEEDGDKEDGKEEDVGEEDGEEEDVGEEDGEVVVKDGKPQSIALPPEYDENDSRWTLRYKTHADDLLELVKKSRIYVKTDNLAAIVVKSQNPKQLARNLLDEVFTHNALSVCKLPQAICVPSPRPDLDAGAVNALLDFVQKHTGVMKWKKVNPQDIKLSLRGKLCYAHKKFEQTGRFT